MRIKFAILSFILLTFSKAHAAPELWVLKDLQSAERNGVNSHILAFKDGQIVSLAEAQRGGCWMTFPAAPALLSRYERLWILFKHKNTQRTPVPVTTLEWELYRHNTGERLKYHCVAEGPRAEALVEWQAWESFGTLIIHDRKY